MFWIVIVSLSLAQIWSGLAFPLHSTRLLSVIRNATSLNSIHSAVDKISTLKSLGDLNAGFSAVQPDLEEGILAANVIEKIATLVIASKEEMFMNDERFNKLTNTVDISIQKLPFDDIARYAWSITVVGLTDKNKYINILNTYRTRLSKHKNSKDSAEKLSTSQIANLIWTCGCIKHTVEISNNTLAEESIQELSNILLNDNTSISSSLSLRVLWSIAMHTTNNHYPRLVDMLLRMAFTSQKPADLSTESILSLLWSLVKLPTSRAYDHERLIIELFDTLLLRLHNSTSVNSIEYKQFMKASNKLLLQEVLQRYHLLSTQLSEQHQQEQGEEEGVEHTYSILLRKMVHKIAEVFISKIDPIEIKQNSVKSAIMILQSIRIIQHDSTASSMQQPSDHCTMLINECLQNLLASIRQHRIEVPALAEILYSLVAKNGWYSITSIQHSEEGYGTMEVASTQWRVEEEEGCRWCEILRKNPYWQQILGITTTQSIEYQNSNTSTSSIDMKSILYTTYVVLECTGHIHEPLLLTLSQTVQTNNFLSNLSFNMLKTLAEILRKAIILRKASNQLPKDDENIEKYGKWMSKTFLEQVLQELLYRCQQAPASTRRSSSIIWKMELLEVITYLDQTVNEMKENKVRGFRYYDNGSSSSSYTEDRVTPAAADSWSTTTNTGTDNGENREIDFDTAPSWLKEDLALEQDSEVHSADGIKGTHNARPYKASFEEEEGLVRHGDRLAALVAAASERNEEGKITSSSTRVEKEESALVPPPVVHSPTVKHRKAVQAVDPQQDTQTTESVEQRIPLQASFDASGYAILSLEEEEGMSTDTDRLKALVAAAAITNKQPIVSADSISTPKSSHSLTHNIPFSIPLHALVSENTSYEKTNRRVCFIDSSSIESLSTRLLQRLYHAIAKSLPDLVINRDETITIIHKEITKRGLSTASTVPLVELSEQRPSSGDLSVSSTRSMRIILAMTRLMQSLYREEFYSMELVNACESAISRILKPPNSSSRDDETLQESFSMGELEGLLLLLAKSVTPTSGTRSNGNSEFLQQYSNMENSDDSTMITIDVLFNRNNMLFIDFIRSYTTTTTTE